MLTWVMNLDFAASEAAAATTDDIDKLVRPGAEFTDAGSEFSETYPIKTIVRVYNMIWVTLFRKFEWA